MLKAQATELVLERLPAGEVDVLNSSLPHFPATSIPAAVPLQHPWQRSRTLDLQSEPRLAATAPEAGFLSSGRFMVALWMSFVPCLS